jgi:hypothetical protein
MRKTTLTIAGLTVAALLATAGGAQASGWITGSQIKDGTVTGADIKDRSLGVIDLSPAAGAALHGAVGAKGAAGVKGATGLQGSQGNKGFQGLTGAKGDSGKDGKDGKDGVSPMLGAYYAVAFYDVGDTNAGAIATVACSAITDTAISGGVQILGLDATANSRNTPVSSSFPGRMDWSTNTPRVDRLDGWIVQFGGGAIAPEKVKVYALCVPNLTVPVVNTYTQSG